MECSNDNLNPLLSTCPVCGRSLAVKVLHCGHCDTSLHGSFGLPALARLPEELQHFVLTFLRARGNIREVERELGISYPTVSKKLETINYLLGAMDAGGSDRTRILRQLEAGEITPADAVARLKKLE